MTLLYIRGSNERGSMRYTLTDVAKQLHQPYHTLYRRVVVGQLPSPTIQVGMRSFYDDIGRSEFVEQYRTHFAAKDTRRMMKTVEHE